MLWGNAQEFCLLCLNYAPYVSHYSLQIQHLISLILLKLQNHEYLQSLFICYPNTVQFLSFQLVPLESRTHLAIHVHTYLYQHFEFLFKLQFDKIITTDSLKSSNPVGFVNYIYWQFLAYYVSIMLNAFATYYAHNYASIIGSSLTVMLKFN